jgi:hypothetical protein
MDGPCSGRYDTELAVSELEYGGGLESCWVEGREISRGEFESFRNLVGKRENPNPRFIDGFEESLGCCPSWIMVVNETESGWMLPE